MEAAIAKGLRKGNDDGADILPKAEDFALF
jgi:hypothetical protein